MKALGALVFEFEPGELALIVEGLGSVYEDAERLDDPDDPGKGKRASSLWFELLGYVPIGGAMSIAQRIDVHGDGPVPHTSCEQPDICNCDCRACKRAWHNAGRPAPPGAIALCSECAGTGKIGIGCAIDRPAFEGTCLLCNGTGRAR